MSKCFLFFVLFVALPLGLATHAVETTRPIAVSENGRYLTYTDGAPFFYLGDTAWELFHRLDREEADIYLRNRAEKGYTVIQAVVIAEISGLTRGNAYDDRPYIAQDSARPREAYFAHVDWIVDRAESLGLYVGMLPTWGRWVGGNDEGKDYHDFFNEGNAEAYGAFLANRYEDKPIIWILGGDRQPTKSRAVWDAMAKGIRGGCWKGPIDFLPSADRFVYRTTPCTVA